MSQHIFEDNIITQTLQKQVLTWFLGGIHELSLTKDASFDLVPWMHSLSRHKMFTPMLLF